MPFSWRTQSISIFHRLSRRQIPPAQGSSQKIEAIYFLHRSKNPVFLVHFIHGIIAKISKNEKNLHNQIFYLYSRHFGHR